jgi:hypothetical protein
MNDTATLTSWTAPAFDEIKMDAEIGSYQQDDEREWAPLVETSPFAAE